MGAASVAVLFQYIFTPADIKISLMDPSLIFTHSTWTQLQCWTELSETELELKGTVPSVNVNVNVIQNMI